MPQDASPERVDLLITAPWILTMDGPDRVLADAAVAVVDGRIAALGDAAELAARYEPERRVDLPRHVLLPGLVNAHGHAAMALLRGSSEDAPLQAWLNKQIWPLEAKWVDEQFVRDGTRLALAEMIRAGITCFADMYYFPEIAAHEARRAGIRAQLAFPVIKYPNAWSSSSAEGFHKGLALHDEYRHDPFIDIAFGPHAVYSVSDDDLDKLLMYSQELDACIHIHLHENGVETAENQERFGRSGIAELHDRGLLGPNLQAVHVTHISEQEIGFFAEANVHVIHCPTSNAKLASGICPAVRLLDAGINVALGTDGAASNNALDLLGEARLAALLAKLTSGDASALPAATALAMATRHGAAALGRAEQTGYLATGLAADLIAVDMTAIHHHPLYDPLAQLVHTPSGSSVSHVWVNGRCLLRDGQLTTLDEAEVRASADAWQRRIRPR